MSKAAPRGRSGRELLWSSAELLWRSAQASEVRAPHE
jgi:hypothetical protein